ncbi:uncharacterized protein LOC135168252 isoform X1 [Diachasmimorpha longicaudata]|uniref:uncharacterized protein LOC135168252 isoform X1 n=1 Tax=Diachasmimorpha longicaudata TaxID=58733 RepID=UPI0030B8DC62
MMSSMAKFSHEDKYDENGRNKSRICCQFCSSVILSSSAGTFLTHEFDLPHMRSKRDEGEEEKVEKLKDYWLVEDMYTFENLHPWLNGMKKGYKWSGYWMREVISSRKINAVESSIYPRTSAPVGHWERHQLVEIPMEKCKSFYDSPAVVRASTITTDKSNFDASLRDIGVRGETIRKIILGV